ncbi:hypothetical protein M2140_000406 [Clostridiales Family XIII bacterium PM5-7]
MKKKLMTILLSATLLVSAAVPAFAEDTGGVVPDPNAPTTEEPGTTDPTDPTDPTEPTEPEEPAPVTKKPAKVTGLKVLKNGYNSLKVTWTETPTAAKYQVYRATKKNGKYVLKKTTTKTSYTNTGLTSGKTYWYKVRAVNAKGKGVFSVKKGNKVRPAKAVITKVSLPKNEQVRVHWKKVAGASGYQVYRKKVGSTKWKLLKTVSKNATYATDKMLGKKSYPWGKYGPVYYDHKDLEYSWEYKVRAYRTVKGKKVYGYFSVKQKYVPDWTVEELYEELWQYGESLTWTMHELVPTYPEPNEDGDYHVAKTDGTTYTLNHVVGWNENVEGEAGIVFTNPERGNTEKNETFVRHTEKNSNWSTLWPMTIHPYMSKEYILKRVKSRMYTDLEDTTFANPLYKGSDFEYNGYTGTQDFSVYFKPFVNGYRLYLLW